MYQKIKDMGGMINATNKDEILFTTIWARGGI